MAPTKVYSWHSYLWGDKKELKNAKSGLEEKEEELTEAVEAVEVELKHGRLRVEEMRRKVEAERVRARFRESELQEDLLSRAMRQYRERQREKERERGGEREAAQAGIGSSERGRFIGDT